MCLLKKKVFEKNQDQPYTPMKLKVETYMFRSTRFETIQLYLAHFSDPSYVTSLSLFGIELNKPSFDNLVRLLATRMPNLKTLSTDILQGKNLDECLVAVETERNVKRLLSRLSDLYLWQCCESIYETVPATVDCSCRLKKRRNCFSNSYDYSFGLYDFTRLFGDGDDVDADSEQLAVRRLTILFAQMCFCEAKSAKKLVEQVLGVLRRSAKSLAYLELRFKCTHCNKYFVKYFNNVAL